MREKKPDVGYIEIQDNAPEEWLGEIEVAFLSYEKLPLLGKPFFNEVLVEPRCLRSGCPLLLADKALCCATAHLPAQAQQDADHHRLLL